jgi:multicomponent Na+:H+ antiporter subunit D
MFLLPALSLAGIPPLSGFVAKLSLIEAGFAIGQWEIVTVSLAVGLLTLFSMVKIWNGVFWGTPDEPAPADATGDGPVRVPRAMSVATGVLVATSLVFVFAAAPILEVSENAAVVLLDRAPYAEAVLSP